MKSSLLALALLIASACYTHPPKCPKHPHWPDPCDGPELAEPAADAGK